MIGETVGNFRVIRRLGQGGMGEVLLAEHKDIQTKVAIKMLLPHISADKQHVQRFFNEAVAVSKIKHAGITKIFDVGYLHNGTAYLVMELLEGESLAHRIERARRLPPEQCADIARQITSVLEATHREGIIHRDLKPDNIFLVPDAELPSGERVKILDFGIAKLGTSGMTQTGGAMGTPTYMSPEQWKNATKVDGRADVYSLGCLVYEMASGRPPFVAESIGELCNMHLNEAPPPLHTIVPDVAPAFEAFVMRLLAKDFQQRPEVRETKAMFSQFAQEFRGVHAETMLPSGTGSHAAMKRWDTPDHAAGGHQQTGAGARPAQPTTLGSSVSAMQVKPEASSGKTKYVVAAGVLLAAGVTAAVVMSRGTDDATKAAASMPTEPAPPPAVTAPAAAPPAQTPPVTPAAPETPSLQRVRIQTVPADATITIDDAVVENPFDGRFPRSEVKHKIEVKAPGYKPDARWLAFNSGHMLMVTLEKEPVAVEPPSRPTKQTTKQTKQTKQTTTTTPVPATTTPPVVSTPNPGSATQTQPAQSSGTNAKPTYKGTKGTIITDYPPN